MVTRSWSIFVSWQLVNRVQAREMSAAGCCAILFFPLYPQYSGATTATANDQFFRALMKEEWQTTSRTVPAYYGEEITSTLGEIEERAYAAAESKPETLCVRTTGSKTPSDGG